MATRRKHSVLGPLRTLFDVGTIRDLTDGQLLERLATGGEAAELAFAALVERHGPLVLRTCRAILRDEHAAEDAFQATFLVLVRKARSLWVRDSLGPWLHQVACRAARYARSAAARRAHVEQRAAAMNAEPVATTSDPAGLPAELVAVLHAEVDRLPERYRVPVILCDLEGRSHEQAARHIGCPVGTVKSRLSRARERLRTRLTRRGLGPSASVIAALRVAGGPRTIVPPALADATGRAALQWFTRRTIVSTAAAVLAKEVLKAMSVTQGLKTSAAALGVAVLVSGIPLLAQPGGSNGRGSAVAPPAGETTLVFEVKPGKLQFSAEQPGIVEAASSSDVFSKVEGETTIIHLAPQGTRVNKGQLVCELDSSKLKDRLINQEVAVRAAEAAYRSAKVAREIAEIAVTEYTDGMYRQAQLAAAGAAAKAQAALKSAESKLDRTRRARKQMDGALAGRVQSPADIVADLDVSDRLQAAEEAVDDGKFALELAAMKRRVLEDFTHGKTVKELKARVEQARSEELARQQTRQLEDAKEKKLRTQIDDCKLQAPGDGIVVYANDSDRLGASAQPRIEEGATVRERQKLFSIPNLTGPFRVRAKVAEEWVGRIKTGAPARVRVAAFPGSVLSGAVETVAPLAEPTARPEAPRHYTALIRLDQPPPGMRPGMAARTEILDEARDTVLGVPFQAVVHFDDKDHVALRLPDGRFEWREVTVGIQKPGRVEIKEGLKAGDVIAEFPAALGKATPPRNQATRPPGAR